MTPQPDSASQPRLAFATLALGLSYGAAGWMAGGRADVVELVALAALIHLACAATIPWLASRRWWHAGLVLLAMSPLVVRATSLETTQARPLAAMLLASMGLAVMLSRRYLDARARRDAEQRRLLDQLPQLRTQMALAEDARVRAEIASQAKTQFFAAASHDLRQPLHALGLFTNTLRDRVGEPEQQSLVDNIGEAVSALDDLFTELLDLTRIDAGGVQARPVDFQVASLWRRLRLHFEPVAFDKGLALTLRGGHHVAHADPVLVERILRNLTANAIRYTEDGGVLVAARRRGDRLLLQVWDSGVGIAPADQQRVFGEFEQVAGNRAGDDTGRRRGLGLGLAIVRRLAGLMDAPIQLQSLPGRGSVFSLWLPLGPLGPDVPQPGRSVAGLGTTLEGRWMVVIDADDEARQELQALLTAWGAQVEAFAGVDAVQRWLRQPPPDPTLPDRTPPDLLIVGMPAVVTADDARQQAALVARLPALFGADLPVLYIGGGLADGAAAGSSGWAPTKDPERLSKPIQPNRLRAMIAFKLGSATADAGARGDQAGW